MRGHLTITGGQLLAWLVGVCLAVALVYPGASPAAAATGVDPRQIALTPDDLPPGFTVDADFTRSGDIDGIGPMYQVGLSLPFTEPNLVAGPVFVLQQITRLDLGIGAGDALTMQRVYWTQRQGYAPTPAGPNDGGTFTLEKLDRGFRTYLVGFVKENMILVTGLGGLDGVVSHARLLELAGISSAKLDAALTR